MRGDQEEDDAAPVVWDKPGCFSRILSNLTTGCWWSFCPPPPPSTKKKSSPETSAASTESSGVAEEVHKDNNNNVPIIRQPPPLTVQTGWPSSQQHHPTVVYICNTPSDDGDDRPRLANHRMVSVDTLTVSGDEASQCSDDDDDDDDELVSPPPIRRRVPPRPARLPPRAMTTSASALRKPLPMRSRTCTLGTQGSCTTTSSRHRRQRFTISEASLKQVYNSQHDNESLSSSSVDSVVGGEWVEEDWSDKAMDSPAFSNTKSKKREAEVITCTSNGPLLSPEEQWMEVWASGGGGQERPLQETRDDEGILQHDVIECPSEQQVESTYLPRCSWLEHSFLSAGSKILFAGWLVFFSTEVNNPPLRQDVVYMILLEDVPKIYLCRDDHENMTTLDVVPEMRVHIQDISKSHGRGIVIQNGGDVCGTLLPISLPSFMFRNHSLVKEFDQLAHRTMAPFRRASPSPTTASDWRQTEYHQEYAPVAQLEAAMHLLFVMDSWMTKMLKRY